MIFSSKIQGQTGTISLDGRFTFETHPAFKACSRGLLTTPITHIVLDMAEVTHMDASSLGVILLLREATQARMAISIRRPSASVLKLLQVVRFDQLFEILT